MVLKYDFCDTIITRFGVYIPDNCQKSRSAMCLEVANTQIELFYSVASKLFFATNNISGSLFALVLTA